MREPAGVEGPYLHCKTADQYVARWIDPATSDLRTRVVRLGETFAVNAPERASAFTVTLREPTPLPARECLDTDQAVFIIGDTHGEFAIVTEFLQRHAIIDSDLRWSFGAGRLVVMGDIVDRGPYQIELLWLFYELQRQAELTGGRVHVLLGNHEVITLRGDQRYLHEKYLVHAGALGADGYDALLSDQTVLGAWIRQWPVMVELTHTLFVHAGVSPDLLARYAIIDAVNEAKRGALDEAESGLLVSQWSPLWYRGHFSKTAEQEVAAHAHVRDVVDHYGVERMIIAHTRVPEVLALHDGLLIAAHVYPERDETGGAHMEGVLIIDDIVYRAMADGKRVVLNASSR